MTRHDLEALLEEVRTGRTPVADALDRVQRSMREAPFEDLGFARLDTHRALRQGFPEVVLGTGKTLEVGYETPSAFVAAFKRYVGTTPGKTKHEGHKEHEVERQF